MVYIFCLGLINEICMYYMLFGLYPSFDEGDVCVSLNLLIWNYLLAIPLDLISCCFLLPDVFI